MDGQRRVLARTTKDKGGSGQGCGKLTPDSIVSRPLPKAPFGMNRLHTPLDSGAAPWRHGRAIERSMPLFLLRDGAIRRCAAVPDGLAITTYTDRHQRQIHVVLDAESERLLLRAQPPTTPRRLGGRRGTSRRTEPPLAA